MKCTGSYGKERPGHWGDTFDSRRFDHLSATRARATRHRPLLDVIHEVVMDHCPPAGRRKPAAGGLDGLAVVEGVAVPLQVSGQVVGGLAGLGADDEPEPGFFRASRFAAESIPASATTTSPRCRDGAVGTRSGLAQGHGLGLVALEQVHLQRKPEAMLIAAGKAFVIIDGPCSRSTASAWPPDEIGPTTPKTQAARGERAGPRRPRRSADLGLSGAARRAARHGRRPRTRPDRPLHAAKGPVRRPTSGRTSAW